MPGLGIAVVRNEDYERLKKEISNSGCTILGILKHEDPEKIRKLLDQRGADPVARLLIIKLYKALDSDHTGVLYFCMDDEAADHLNQFVDKLIEEEEKKERGAQL